jgi:chromosome segregation ATPase
MPPFAEHFQRWMLDLDALLTDFRSSLPEAADVDFNKAVEELVSRIRGEFAIKIEAEKTLVARITEYQNQLAASEREMSELEAEQRVTANDAKRTSEKSMKKIRGEIDALDGERLRLLRYKPTILDKILGRSKVKIDDTSRSLQSRRTDLSTRQRNLKRHLDDLRASYEQKHQPLADRQAELRQELAKLRATTLDDALEARKATAERISQLISNAVTQIATGPNQNNPQ